MASVSYHISSLLEKMTSTDKDFRCGTAGRAGPCGRKPPPAALGALQDGAAPAPRGAAVLGPDICTGFIYSV